jgi:hypothetical protein
MHGHPSHHPSYPSLTPLATRPQSGGRKRERGVETAGAIPQSLKASDALLALLSLLMRPMPSLRRRRKQCTRDHGSAGRRVKSVQEYQHLCCQLLRLRHIEGNPHARCQALNVEAAPLAASVFQLVLP